MENQNENKRLHLNLIFFNEQIFTIRLVTCKT